MNKTPKRLAKKTQAKPKVAAFSTTDFDTVLRLIESAQVRAVAAVNTTLIDLYWKIGNVSPFAKTLNTVERIALEP
jgi:hypothetical protein